MKRSSAFDRRRFLAGSAALGGLALAAPRRAWGQASPAIVTADSMRPQAPYGVMSGDVSADSAIVWSRADRPSRMIVEYASSDSFTDVRRIVGPHAIETTDFTARVMLRDLAPGQDVFYRVSFQDLGDLKTTSVPATGRFRTAPGSARDITFQWSGDTRRPGLGHQPGMGRHEDLRGRCAAPARLLHPLRRHDLRRRRRSRPRRRSRRLDLEEHRHARKEQGRRDARRVPRQLPLQPDGRERPPLQRRGAADLAVGRPRGDQQLVGRQGRFQPTTATPKSACRCWSRARRAPSSNTRRCGRSAEETERVYRHIPYGPLLDVFVIDMRSYRGPNTLQPAGDGRRRDRLPRPRADPVAEAGPAALARDLEGDRGRHADRPAGRRWQGCRGPRQVREPRQRRRPAARPRAGDRRPAALHQARRHQEHRLGDRRYALYRSALLRPGQGPVHRLRPVLGVHVAGRSTPARSVRARPTTRSASMSSGRRRPSRGRRTCRPRPACSSTARPGSRQRPAP